MADDNTSPRRSPSLPPSSSDPSQNTDDRPAPSSRPSPPPRRTSPSPPTPSMRALAVAQRPPLPQAAHMHIPEPSSSSTSPQPLADRSSAGKGKGKARASSRQPSSRSSTPLKRSTSSSPPIRPAPRPPQLPAVPPRQPVAAADLLPLLRCPACPPHSPLVQPTSLLCGHTVCASHVTLQPGEPASSPRPSPLPSPPLALPSCPIAGCDPRRPRTRELTPIAGSSSQPRVVCYPSGRTDAPGPRQGPPIRVARARLDTTVANLMGVIVRSSEQEAAARRREEGDEDDEDEDEEQDGREGLFGTDEEGSDDEEETGQRARERPDPPSYAPPPPTYHDPPSPTAPRPRKRPRRHTHLHSLPPPAATDAPSDAPDPEGEMTRLEKELLNELSCPMCYLMLHEPVTTPCQHTFCAKCLQRSLDHGTACPICREELPNFTFFEDHPPSKVLLSIMLTAFPEAYAERRRLLLQEAKDSRLDTPIFYSLLAFPGMPFVLHFFEPRYRLMLRRVMEDQTFRFGTIMASRAGGAPDGLDYGTMMEIRSVQMLPDGRSLIEAVGSWRFRIVERGVLDGYTVGRIERVDDYGPEVEREVDPNLNSIPIAPSMPFWSGGGLSQAAVERSDGETEPTNAQLMATCREFLDQLRSGSAPWVVQRLNESYGDSPSDPSSFSFWMAAVLPIEETEKAKLLPIRSARLRLRLIVHWIESLNNNWWFSNGCTIA